jgi:hypothetical protein
MATYEACLMHGVRGTEGRYRFEGPEDLMDKSPARVMRHFMEWVDAEAGLGHVDYELNAAMKNDQVKIVTALGTMNFSELSRQPFVCMIARAQD